MYSPNTGDDEHGLPRSGLLVVAFTALFPNKCDEEQGLSCDLSRSIFQFHVVSDLQALEHVSKPHNKPAERGFKNHVMLIKYLIIMIHDR